MKANSIIYITCCWQRRCTFLATSCNHDKWRTLLAFCVQYIEKVYLFPFFVRGKKPYRCCRLSYLKILDSTCYSEKTGILLKLRSFMDFTALFLKPRKCSEWLVYAKFGHTVKANSIIYITCSRQRRWTFLVTSCNHEKWRTLLLQITQPTTFGRFRAGSHTSAVAFVTMDSICYSEDFIEIKPLYNHS